MCAFDTKCLLSLPEEVVNSSYKFWPNYLINIKLGFNGSMGISEDDFI
jgi:hypothetical protein